MNRANWMIIILSLNILGLLLGCSKDNGEEKPSLPNINVEDYSITRPSRDSSIQLRVAVEGISTTNIILRYSTKNGSATAGVDFTEAIDRTLIIPPGAVEAFIPITIRRSNFNQAARSFEIVLVNVTNGIAARNAAVVTIRNNQSNPGGLLIPQTGYVTPTAYDGYQLIWADEFTSPQLNETYWTHEIGRGNNGWGNNELQFYRPENTYMHGGEFLVIEAREQAFSGAQYTSSRIITSGKASFKYGRVDIRAALPETQGLWPALWMLGESFWSRGWPSCGEIDIMEMLGHQPDKVYGTAHWGPNFNQRQLKERSIFSQPGGNFHDRFHVFSIVWEEDRIQWFVDDRPYNTLTPADMNGFEYPFNEAFFFIFNVAVGGQWPGNPDQSTVFPQRMIVDYIRVFQKTN
jgi:beta-glucanase (GH16 family)